MNYMTKVIKQIFTTIIKKVSLAITIHYFYLYNLFKHLNLCKF